MINIFKLPALHEYKKDSNYKKYQHKYPFLAFYKANQSKATLLDKIIALFTFGPYSHVELVFTDGVAYSTSPRDKCTRFKNGINFDDGTWDKKILYGVIEEDLKEYCKNRKVFRYDYIGAIFSGVIPNFLKFCFSRTREFCSETCGTCVYNTNKHFYKLEKSCRLNPNELYRRMK